MSHRAQQIIDAVASLVRARVEGSGVHVFTHRRLSLDPEQDELPGISVDYGDLTVELEDTEEHYYDCNFVVLVTGVNVNAEESVLRESLMDMAVSAQAAINATSMLGLDFVFDTSFNGWTAPEVDQRGGVLAGSIASSWQVRFRMHFEDAEESGSVPNL